LGLTSKQLMCREYLEGQRGKKGPNYDGTACFEDRKIVEEDLLKTTKFADKNWPETVSISRTQISWSAVGGLLGTLIGLAQNVAAVEPC
jgi:hypothetical protein